MPENILRTAFQHPWALLGGLAVGAGIVAADAATPASARGVVLWTLLLCVALTVVIRQLTTIGAHRTAAAVAIVAAAAAISFDVALAVAPRLIFTGTAATYAVVLYCLYRLPQWQAENTPAGDTASPTQPETPVREDFVATSEVVVTDWDPSDLPQSEACKLCGDSASPTAEHEVVLTVGGPPEAVVLCDRCLEELTLPAMPVPEETAVA